MVIPLGSKGMIGADFVAAGKQIITITDTQITTWDRRTLRRLHTIPQTHLEAGHPVVAGVSPDGRTVAIGSSLGSVFFVDVAGGHVTPGAGAHSGAVDQLVFSPDGGVLVSAGDDGKIIVWDRATAQPIETLTGHGGRITGAALSRDGRTLYTASLDGVIFEWDLGGRRRFGQPFTTMSRRSQVAQDAQAFGLAGRDVQAVPPPLAVSPDGSEFAARAGTSSVGLYSTRTLERLQRFPVQAGGNVIGLAWSSAGQLAVTGDSGHVQLWDVTGRPTLLRALRGLRSINKYPEAVTTAAFSPDGRLVAAGDINHTADLAPYRLGSVAVWDVRSGKLLWKVTTRHGWVSAVTFSPDGKTIAVAREDGVVLLDNPRTGRTERTLHLEGGGIGLETAAFAPDGTLATGTRAGIVQLWNPATGAQIGHPTPVAAAPVASIAFDPDERHLRDDRRLRRSREALDDDDTAAVRRTVARRSGSVGNCALHARRVEADRCLSKRKGLRLACLPRCMGGPRVCGCRTELHPRRVVPLRQRSSLRGRLPAPVGSNTPSALPGPNRRRTAALATSPIVPSRRPHGAVEKTRGTHEESHDQHQGDLRIAPNRRRVGRWGRYVRGGPGFRVRGAAE